MKTSKKSLRSFEKEILAHSKKNLKIIFVFQEKARERYQELSEEEKKARIWLQSI